MRDGENKKNQAINVSKKLIYGFLDEESNHLVIINAYLGKSETEKLLVILKRYLEAIGYTIKDFKGISTSIYMRKIFLEEDYKPYKEHQMRLSTNIREVVKKGVPKLLDVGVIYPILDNKWVSPIQVVPKKGDIIVIKVTRM